MLLQVVTVHWTERMPNMDNPHLEFFFNYKGGKPSLCGFRSHLTPLPITMISKDVERSESGR